MTPARLQSGFTLIEIVLVMVVITVALAIAAPSLRNWGKARQRESEAAQLEAVAKWARQRAISDATTYRLNLDAHENSYWVTYQSGQSFIAPGSSFGRVFTLPEGYGLQAVTPTGAPLDVIEFAATGRTQMASIRLIARDGSTSLLTTDSPARPLRIQQRTEAQR